MFLEIFSALERHVAFFALDIFDILMNFFDVVTGTGLVFISALIWHFM